MSEPIRSMYERGFGAWAFYWFSRTVCRVVGLFWFGLIHHGRRRFEPKTGAVLMVANHCSFLDPVLVGTGTGRLCHYLARSSLGDVPFLGSLLGRYGVTFIDRDAPAREDLQKAIELLRKEQILLIFPEGRRSRDGMLHEFKRGTVTLARRTGATIVPVGIRGADRAFPPGIKVPRPVRCSVHYGEPMTPDELAAPGGLAELESRVAALSLQQRAPREEQIPGDASDGESVREIPKPTTSSAAHEGGTSLKADAPNDASAVNTGAAGHAER